MKQMKHTIRVERVYADPAGYAQDGFRVFVDRLWPRGESKEKFHYDLWAKEISPSTPLREWYHADPQNRWGDFVEKYRQEFDTNPATRDFITSLAPHPVITLLYASRDETHNNAVALKEILQQSSSL